MAFFNDQNIYTIQITRNYATVESFTSSFSQASTRVGSYSQLVSQIHEEVSASQGTWFSNTLSSNFTSPIGSATGSYRRIVQNISNGSTSSGGTTISSIEIFSASSRVGGTGISSDNITTYISTQTFAAISLIGFTLNCTISLSQVISAEGNGVSGNYEAISYSEIADALSSVSNRFDESDTFSVTFFLTYYNNNSFFTGDSASSDTATSSTVSGTQQGFPDISFYLNGSSTYLATASSILTDTNGNTFDSSWVEQGYIGPTSSTFSYSFGTTATTVVSQLTNISGILRSTTLASITSATSSLTYTNVSVTEDLNVPKVFPGNAIVWYTNAHALIHGNLGNTIEIVDTSYFPGDGAIGWLAIAGGQGQLLALQDAAQSYLGAFGAPNNSSLLTTTVAGVVNDQVTTQTSGWDYPVSVWSDQTYQVLYGTSVLLGSVSTEIVIADGISNRTILSSTVSTVSTTRFNLVRANGSPVAVSSGAAYSTIQQSTIDFVDASVLGYTPQYDNSGVVIGFQAITIQSSTIASSNPVTSALVVFSGSDSSAGPYAEGLTFVATVGAPFPQFIKDGSTPLVYSPNNLPGVVLPFGQVNSRNPGDLLVVGDMKFPWLYVIGQRPAVSSPLPKQGHYTTQDATSVFTTATKTNGDTILATTTNTQSFSYTVWWSSDSITVWGSQKVNGTSIQTFSETGVLKTSGEMFSPYGYSISTKYNPIFGLIAWPLGGVQINSNSAIAGFGEVIADIQRVDGATTNNVTATTIAATSSGFSNAASYVALNILPGFRVWNVAPGNLFEGSYLLGTPRYEQYGG